MEQHKILKIVQADSSKIAQRVIRLTAQVMAVSAVMGTKVNFLRRSHPAKHAQIHRKTDPSYLADLRDLATIPFFSGQDKI
jgi:hypothetical protein